MNSLNDLRNKNTGKQGVGDSLEELPSISLVLCSRNRTQMLIETVASILEGDQVPAEIVIIDQSDKPSEQLDNLKPRRSCAVHYVWTCSKGLSRGNNLGISIAHYDLIAFTHDDVFAAPGWFTALGTALVKAGPNSIVTGQVCPTESETEGGFQLTLKTDQIPENYEGRIGKDVLYPLNMAMYRSAILAIGGFDERLGPGTPFPGGEDNDFGFRLLEAGYRIIYVPEAVIYHRAWRSSAEYLPLRWAYGIGRGGFYAKHLGLRDRYMLLRMLRDIRLHLMLFARRFRSEPSHAYGDALLAFGILYGAAQWLCLQSLAQLTHGKRRGHQRERVETG